MTTLGPKALVVLAGALFLLASGTPAAAQQSTPVDPKQNEEQAMAALKRAAEFLSQAQRFSVTVDIGFDVVQDSGQKIEFGETRRIVLRRPDRLRVDDVRRNGAKNGVLFDGKALTVFNGQEKVYATVAKSGTVDEFIHFYINDLALRLPLAELLDSNLPKILSGQVRAAAYVEPAEIAGVPCDHVAFRGHETDIQLWIARGAEPLPRRVVITYRRDDGRPQFWAQFRDWNLAPETPDSLFTFTPPTDAVKITVVPRTGTP